MDLPQVFLEPTQYQPQTLQAELGMTASREAVALTFKAHELYFASEVLQSGEELLSLLDIAAQVLFAVEYQQRRMDVLYIGNRREAHVGFKVVPGRCLQFVIGEDPAKVAAAEVR